MILEYDKNVQGEIYYEPDFPRIRYFKDWGRYILQTEEFGALKVAVIGGAYSVDKFYRLQMGHQWFEDEELTKEEMRECLKELVIGDNQYDLVLTHTCPLSVEPSDLFLPMIDQSTVSKNMEYFLDNFRYCITWNIWLFGHYHVDRIERPHIEQFYKDTESLNDILFRWNNYDITKELDWWLEVSPNFEKKLDNPWEEEIYD